MSLSQSELMLTKAGYLFHVVIPGIRTWKNRALIGIDGKVELDGEFKVDHFLPTSFP